VTYKNAGVDVKKGDDLVDWLIDSNPSKKKEKNVVSGIGGFAALYRVPWQKYKSPLLVSSTDGVGTKVKLAAQFNRYEGIGQDLVAMCVNDLACVGAQPLFFLDYYASAKLNLRAAQSFLSSVRGACRASNCELIGGETAEMPGVYAKNDFDCAGFSVGIVDESAVLGAHNVRAGDCIIGVASSGFHSNGYSLLRRVFARDLKKWSNILLRPTHLYSPLVQNLLAKKIALKAAAHVTGGGLDNLLRVVPSGTRLELEPWPVPHEFLEVKARAKIQWPELLRTLNCGIGFVLFVGEKDFDSARRAVKASGFASFDLGRVAKNKAEPKGEPVWTLDTNRLGELKKKSHRRGNS
jgi:phosphoribosylformylglycinamidine cyclo-ligase